MDSKESAALKQRRRKKMEELRLNISAKWEDVGKQLTSKLVYREGHYIHPI